jgi:hypothetical protein
VRPANFTESSLRNSFSRNSPVTRARTSSTTALVKSNVAGSEVAKNETSTGIALPSRFTASILNVFESSPAWERRTISCLVRCADLPFMVRAVYKQLVFRKIPQTWDYLRPSPALLSSRSVEASEEEIPECRRKRTRSW